jgi:hypothetical protein
VRLAGLVRVLDARRVPGLRVLWVGFARMMGRSLCRAPHGTCFAAWTQ